MIAVSLEKRQEYTLRTGIGSASAGKIVDQPAQAVCHSGPKHGGDIFVDDGQRQCHITSSRTTP
jgi:hypothetical protein